MQIRALALRAAMTAFALAALATPSRADVMIFSFDFDNTFNGTVTPPFVGSGTLTLATNPGVGTFAYTDLSPTISFNFTNGASFNQAQVTTPVANILIQITNIGGGTSSLLFGGSGGGPQGGSIDFNNGSSILSFQPSFGSLYFSSTFSGTFQGLNTAAIPEPSALTLAATCGLVGLIGLARRRMTAAA